MLLGCKKPTVAKVLPAVRNAGAWERALTPGDDLPFYWNPVTSDSVWHRPVFLWTLEEIIIVPRLRPFFAEFLQQAHLTDAISALNALVDIDALDALPRGPARPLACRALMACLPAADRLAPCVAESFSQAVADSLLDINPFASLKATFFARLTFEADVPFRESQQIGEMEHVLRVEHEMYPPTWDKADPLSSVDGWMVPTFAQTLHTALRKFAGRPFFGVRRGDGYDNITYEAVHVAAEEFGSALVAELDGIMAADSRPFVAVCANNRPEWCIADLGCFFKGIVSVPLARVSDVETAQYILNHAEVAAVVCSSETLPLILAAAVLCPRLRLVILMNMFQMHGDAPLPCNSAVQAAALHLRLVLMSDLLPVGRGRRLARYAHSETDASTIMYTSGSTGRPKGVVISYQNWNRNLATKYLVQEPYVLCSFQPLSHAGERSQYLIGLKDGVYMAFYSGSMDTIFDDMALCRPTQVSGPPRFYNMIYSEFQRELAQRGTPTMTPTALAAARAATLALFRGVLGGRVRTLVTGSAPTSPAVMAFLRECFECPLIDGYGSTEAGGISNDNKIVADVEYKLADVPDLSYFASGTPFPRGEVLVKTKTMLTEYYKNPEATRNAFTEDGYFRTGDIGQLESDGTLRLIDRVKNVFKLAQGEFIAAENLEVKFLESTFISQIYIHCDPLKSFLMCVVVPNMAVLCLWAATSAGAAAAADDIPALCGSAEAILQIARELQRVGKKAGLWVQNA